MNILWWPIACAIAVLHCLVRHGGGPVHTEHHGQFVLMCPACGRVFWRDRF